MSISKYHIKPEEISISPAIIANLMGVDKNNIPEPYDSMINTELSKIQDYTDIYGGYKIFQDFEINEKEGILRIEQTIFDTGKQVTKYLKAADKLALFICTAGGQVNQRSKKLMSSGDTIEGYICDLLGSILVEEAMSIIQSKLNLELNKKGENTSNRYSPGYCNWDVAEQQKLFDFFPKDFCGVSLSSSSLMSPIKSISGVFAIGKQVKFHKYVCSACSSVNCIYRNHKYSL
jgi:Vitamin B12 dependent methionine synthase, activation domain